MFVELSGTGRLPEVNEEAERSSIDQFFNTATKD